MIEMTDTARQRLEAYLSRLRAALRGTRVEPDEMERDVREHVELALAGAEGPVGADHLAQVLERLGPPERWLPEEERPAWKRTLDRFIAGPEDWRLPYLSFAFFAAMFVFLPIGGALLLIPSYLLSRACVSLLHEKGEPLGPRKWLVYPPIAMVLVLMAGLLLLAPASGVMAWAFEEGGLEEIMRATSIDRTRVVIALAAGSFGVWWMLASALIAFLRRPLQAAVRPLLDGLQARHLLVLTIAGAVLTAVAALVIFV